MNEDTTRFDVVIVGGGPSGSSAARLLAKSGLKVLIAERKVMPRRKVCGGALSEQAMSFLDFDIPPELIDWECYGARVHYKNTTLEAKLQDRIAVLTTRSEFDAFLLSKALEAGATLINSKVTSIEDKDSGLLINLGSRLATAKKCIIAAGANSKLISLVRKRDNAHTEGICLEAEIPVFNPDKFADLNGLIDIHFGGAAYGYGWVFHHGSYYSVGVGGLRSKFKSPMQAMKTFCKELEITGWEESVKGHPIPRGGIQRTISKGNIFLAGDSAGFVDPFYGEGLAYAIRSGQLAAQVISEWFNFPAQCPHTLYKKLTANEFDINLRYSPILSKLMYSIPSIFLKTLTADRKTLEKYLQVPLSTLSYKQFILWLIPRLPFILAKTAKS